MTDSVRTGLPRPRPLRHVATCLWAVAVLAGVVVGFYALALPAVLVVPDPVLAQILVTGVAGMFVLLARRSRPGWFADPDASPDPGAGAGSHVGSSRLATPWGWILGASVLAFVAGQMAAAMVYEAVGSSGFDAQATARSTSTVLLALALTLVVAPFGEEALFRGFAQPLLRRRMGVLPAVLASTAVFSALHGNLVQGVATVPLGIVLALVMEHFVASATRSSGGRAGASRHAWHRPLWPVVGLHSGFNLASVVVAPSLVAGMSSVPTLVLVVAAWLVCTVCMVGRLGLARR